MPKGKNQKLKLLYLADLFYKKTDINHHLPMRDIIKYLEKYGIEANRTSIYDDMKCLMDFGMDIGKCRNGSVTEYYLDSRMFEIAELKLLTDIIYSSKFITGKKTKELCKTIGRLTSTYMADELKNQIIVPDRIKSQNKSIFYNVDSIQDAMQSGNKLVFKYFSWNYKSKKIYHHDGDFLMVSPWAVCYDNDNYYMIGYDGEKIKHYRIDKMEDVECISEKREGYSEFKKTNIKEYTATHFGMFGGELEKVVLLCKKDIANVIIDKFGKKLNVLEETDDFFEVEAEVNISNQFFGWVAGLGGDVKILSPAGVKESYKNMLKNILDNNF